VIAIRGPRRIHANAAARNKENGEDHGDRTFLSITVVKMSLSLARDSNTALRLQSIFLTEKWLGERSTFFRFLA